MNVRRCSQCNQILDQEEEIVCDTCLEALADDKEEQVEYEQQFELALEEALEQEDGELPEAGQGSE
jgi:hypothetical protein